MPVDKPMKLSQLVKHVALGNSRHGDHIELFLRAHDCILSRDFS